MENKIKRKELLQIVTKLYKLFTASSLQECNLDLKLAIRIACTFDTWVTCEGLPGLKRAKLCSNIAVRYLMGVPLDEAPLSNRYRRLISKALTLCTCTKSKVYWVSVFSLFRLYKLKPVYDITTITSSFKGRLIGLFKMKYLKSLKTVKQSFRSCNIDQNWNAKWKWHISGSGGPNGLLSYTQYLNDLRSLSHTRLGLYLVMYLLIFPYVNKREALKALRDALTDSLRLGDKQSYHSRLAFLSDKGGKTRVIALVDILTQSCLKTVHQRCNLVLRRIHQDGTFDQNQARCFIKEMSRRKYDLASIDLTAATDRIPVLFQASVLIYLRILSPLQALVWYLVLTKRDFLFKNDKNELKYVRYAVGQPMGALSSWPVMAISHHFLVRWAYAASGFKHPEKTSYRVLGDDLTLRGFDVADVYLDLISCLGIDFSPDKTYISRGVAEFAKSLFCGGEELTPFPLALLRFNINTVVSNVQATITECDRIKLSVTAQVITGLYPIRQRKLVLLAALALPRPHSVLDLKSRTDTWFFLQFVQSKKIRRFSRVSFIERSIHAFYIEAPIKLANTLSSPYLQVGQDNGNSYPVRQLGDDSRLLSPQLLIGQNWISYDTVCWPNGIPPLGDRTLNPGPIWERNKDDPLLRSSLLEFNKLLPNYFTVRCVGKQVGE